MEVFRDDVKSGLFILAALLIFLFGIFQVGGLLEAMQPGREIALGFENSMRVTPGTEVLYRGKKIGRVDTIDFDAEGPGVKILCTIDPDTLIYSGTLAKIDDKSALGGKVIELYPPKLLPGQEFKPLGDDEVIGALPPGGITAMIDSLTGFVDEFGAQLGPIVQRLDNVLLQLEATLSTTSKGIDKMGDIAPNVDKTLSTYRELGENLDARMTTLIAKIDQSMDRVVPAATDTMTEFKDMAAQIKADVSALRSDLDKVLSQTNGLVANADGMITDNRAELQKTLAVLHQTLVNMEVLTRQISERPNSLIFKRKGISPPDVSEQK